jgi:RHS repeat-associated protein
LIAKSSQVEYYTHSPSAIGGIISRDNNGTKLFYHYDRLGNVMAVTDSNGNPYAVYTMEAFGNVFQVGTSTGYYSSQSDPQPYHLTTKEYDPDTQLYYFNARWYDPVPGRFTPRAEVPVEKEHPYVFCANNPGLFVDPTGQILDPIICYLVGRCMRDIALEVDSEYAGDAPYDKFKHCLTSCRARRECCHPWQIGCGACIQFLGYCQERRRGWNPKDSPGDCRATAAGVNCANWSKNGCEACCTSEKGYCAKRRE